MVLTVIESPEFIDWISENPMVGDRLASGEVVLLLVYAKTKFDNLRPEFLVKLKERFDGQT